ncbi:MAG: hypothetical protein Q9159_007388 [Coniocarpon cinnabarinum]
MATANGTEVPCTPESFKIGIIGMGLMGKMYARYLSEAGWTVYAADIPSKYEALAKEFESNDNVHILEDGHLVSRVSDWIMYSVEAENIESVVAKYGRSTKANAIVGGQTSCKAPEIAAFTTHLPQDTDIISCHSLHGPSVNPTNQPLVLIPQRDTRSSLTRVSHILSCLGSKQVTLSAEAHDRITADTQAVTHAAFLSMGAAWKANDQYPWQMGRYLGGIENVKINITLRIYANKWHVYAGLAILNPAARVQIRQYATSVTELFKLMLAGQRTDLESRVHAAGAFVFGTHDSPAQPQRKSLLLQDAVLDRFTLGTHPTQKLRNNHLSLLAMVDSWHILRINPFEHMICSTPLFRLWLGAAEYLFRKPSLLQEALDTALEDATFRADDLEFTFAARDWSQRVALGNMEGYRLKFEEVKEYFGGMFEEAGRVGEEMVRAVLEGENG